MFWEEFDFYEVLEDFELGSFVIVDGSWEGVGLEDFGSYLVRVVGFEFG